MRTDRMDAILHLQLLARDARQAGRPIVADALERAATLAKRALERANAQETLRDRMAIAALPGVMAWPAEYLPNPGHAAMAEAAYDIADAMMAAREKLQ